MIAFDDSHSNTNSKLPAVLLSGCENDCVSESASCFENGAIESGSDYGIESMI